MPFNPDKHHRRSIRLQGYDYAQGGAYFVTICTAQKACLFGEIENELVCLNDIGRMVADTWLWLQEHYPYVELDELVVMPNHLHGILVIQDDSSHGKGGSRAAPTVATKTQKPLGQLIGAFKTVSTKQVNLLRGSAGEVIWQRNYYEHVIRSEASLNSIRQYIQFNPSKWMLDSENPNRQL